MAQLGGALRNRLNNAINKGIENKVIRLQRNRLQKNSFRASC
jgi:hypothetical protein